LERLLVAAVADADSGVRRAVFLALEKTDSFNDYLAQADSLRAIFIALTDEVGVVLLSQQTCMMLLFFCEPVLKLWLFLTEPVFREGNSS
jgi:hypothetical protein